MDVCPHNIPYGKDNQCQICYKKIMKIFSDNIATQLGLDKKKVRAWVTHKKIDNTTPEN